ncbi:hypothetical protein BST81_19550 [Leptolyngbya sp. 'hensonii']|uniref:phage tail protein n=1 Tax=Leptolyngbya sp. 'hensonii' TaxID=1922337 RepID=UPI00094F7759|nr:phage tail protein [Leptolyngbya sp. 'hensonii']OLP16637.1 hypothetical protein BST81_19550 [Leptolyngbya sp. 'hensonii']
MPKPPPKTGTGTLPEILTTSRFYVELKVTQSDMPDAYFMECKGIKYSVDLIEVAEVAPLKGQGKATQGLIVRSKIPGSFKVGNITLRRGMLTNSNMFWTWLQSVHDGQWSTQRKEGSLVIYTQSGTEGARFQFSRAWPISYSFAGSNVSQGEMAIEELEIAVEDLKRTT